MDQYLCIILVIKFLKLNHKQHLVEFFKSIIITMTNPLAKALEIQVVKLCYAEYHEIVSLFYVSLCC